MAFQFSAAELSKISEAYALARQTLTLDPNVIGAFSKTYELIRVIISADVNGVPLYTDAQIAALDLSTFTLSGIDTTGWQPRTDGGEVFDNSWVFLSGVADVNRNAMPDGSPSQYSNFIRAYSAEQYKTRFGQIALSDEQLNEKIQEASNGIAQNIIQDILSLDDNNQFNPDLNPNHELPDINDIANNDAEAAAAALFTQAQIAGWAGNALLLSLGHKDSYYQNILHHPFYGGDGDIENTYDILSVLDSMKAAAGTIGVLTSGGLFVEVLSNVSQNVTGAAGTIYDAAFDTNSLLNNAYGGFVTLGDASLANIVLDHIGHNGSLAGTSGDDYLHGADGNDTLLATAGEDVLDGGAGLDTVDYSFYDFGFLSNLTVDLSQGIAVFPLGAMNIDEQVLRHLENVTGSNFDDEIIGDGNNNILNGNGGDDALSGGAGNDIYVFNGAFGEDAINDSDGSIVINGNTLSGEAERVLDNVWQLGDGDYNLTLSGGNLLIASSSGGSDSITIQNFSETDTKLGISLAENITYGDGNSPLPGALNGTDGNDAELFASLEPSAGPALIVGRFGNDNIRGWEQNDTLLGGDGNDTVNGVAGNDLVFGNAGNDYLTGFDATLNGGAGNDTLWGGGTNAPFTGGTGSDTFLFSFGTNTITDFQTTEDKLDFSFSETDTDAFLIYTSNAQGYAQLELKNAVYHFTTILQSVQSGQLSASSFVNDFAPKARIQGTLGNDHLSGFGGDDTLLGGSSILPSQNQNDGNDTFDGGDGFDTYYLPFFGGQRDVIIDSDGQGQILYDAVGPAIAGGALRIGTNQWQLEYAAGNYPAIRLERDTGTNDLTLYRLPLEDTLTIKGFFPNANKLGITLSETIFDGNSALKNFYNGTAGNDVLTLFSEVTNAAGLAGNDSITGLSNNDSLFGGDGADTLVGAAGNNELYGNAGADTFIVGVHAGATDYLGDFNTSGEKIDLTAFQNITSFGDLSLSNNNGDTVIALANGQSVRVAGVAPGSLNASHFTFYVPPIDYGQQNGNGALPGAINGTSGNDNLNGTSGNDVIVGLAGQDAINAQSGNDTLLGGDGNDTLDGVTGDDMIYGNAGDDYLNTGALPSNATLDGGTGNDTLFGGNGNTLFTTGTGSDVVMFHPGYGSGIKIVTDFDLANDKIDLSAYGNTYPSLISLGISNNAQGNAQWTMTGSTTVILQGVSAAQLSPTHFINDYINPAGGGTAGPDLLQGNASDNTLLGLAGNDTILGFAGIDTIYGGTDDDSIDGGLNSDNIYGEDGNDYLLGGTGNDGDNIFGGLGDDTIIGNGFMSGEDGNDSIQALADGNYYIQGDAGDDTLVGNVIGGYMFGGGGNDTLIINPSASFQQFTGDAGADTFKILNTGSSSGPILFSDFMAADDKIDLSLFPTLTSINDLTIQDFGFAFVQVDANVSLFLPVPVSALSASNFIFYGVPGQTVTGGNSNDALAGGEGADLIEGGSGADSIQGGGGNDTIHAGNDSPSDLQDTVFAGAGNDIVTGGYHHDALYGQAGNDTLEGGLHNDLLDGGDGDDSLIGGEGNDTLIGGAGMDTFLGGAGNDVIAIGDEDYRTVDGGTGADSITGSSLDDTLIGGDSSAADLQDTLLGGLGNDSLYGGYHHDQLFGGEGNDTLDGGLHNDLLDGGAGDDSLIGGDGNDTLIGGTGMDTFLGGAGNDVITISAEDFRHVDGGAGADSITGSSLDDTIIGGDSSAADLQDTLLGGLGNDYLVGGYHHDLLFGGDGNDTLDGGLHNDLLDGGEGNDLLQGGDGNDTLIGGAGIDTFQGGAGNDVIAISAEDYRVVDGGTGADSITGTALDDTLIGGDSSAADLQDTLFGGLGNDSLLGGYHHDQLFGGEGNDTLDGGLHDDLLDGGDGDDSLLGGDGNDTLIGGAGMDTFLGGAGNDVIAISTEDYRTVDGGTGADSITGSSLDDTLIGGDSSAADLQDTLLGGLGNDSLRGGYHHDQLFGGAENDTLDGGLHNDLLDGGEDNDLLLGGDGNDTLIGGLGVDSFDGGAGNDVITAEADDYPVINAGAGADSVQGSSANEIIIGGDSAAADLQDTLKGGGGDDLIQGGYHYDQLSGEDGNDTLEGGWHQDTLTGGTGADTFLYLNVSDFGSSLAAYDLITDFSQADGDKIDLSALTETYNFRGNNGLQSGGGKQIAFSFTGSDTLIEGDTNGNGTADFRLLLTGNIALTAGDFVL